jgi:hypothetical protein
MDNDAYGHVNNVVYYSWFDTAVNAHLIEQGVLDIHQGETIGLVIETQCNYFRPAGLSPDGRGRDAGGHSWAPPACAMKSACLRRASP